MHGTGKGALVAILGLAITGRMFHCKPNPWMYFMAVESR
jgi:hypothetical protein